MAKEELISAIKPRYLKSSKKEKGKILDEFFGNAEYNRKYAIKILQAGYDHFLYLLHEMLNTTFYYELEKWGMEQLTKQVK